MTAPAPSVPGAVPITTSPPAMLTTTPPQTLIVDDPFPKTPSRKADIETVRFALATWTMWLFAAAMLGGFLGAICSAETWDRVKDWLLIVVPIITLLIGGTVAHYFDKRV